MRTVYHAENLIDAHLVKDALERDGIPAFIAGEYLAGAQLPARDLIAVMVPEGSIELAEPRVREVEAILSESRAQVCQDSESGQPAPWSDKGTVSA